jgi:hypothetical protein
VSSGTTLEEAPDFDYERKRKKKKGGKKRWQWRGSLNTADTAEVSNLH